MPIKVTLQEDMKIAMKAHDSVTLNTVRFLISEIRNVEIDHGEQSDTQIQDIIRKQVRQMEESNVQYSAGNRPELAVENNQKIAVLQRYLPEDMSPAELEKLVEATIAANPGLPMGQIIGLVKQVVQGKAQGAAIAELVKKSL